MHPYTTHFVKKQGGSSFMFSSAKKPKGDLRTSPQVNLIGFR